ncbi:MAG: molybdenum cofactor guanylyltransferase [Bacillota bacterium]|jgi:molybdopterin-guanine dinucleotide biosynthesis protein A
MEPVYAVVLAGDNEDHKIKQGSVIPNKAFIKINGRNMVEYVLDCLRETEGLAEVAIIGPEDKFRKLGEGFRIIPQQGDMIENIKVAAETFRDGWLLLCSCDIPLLTPAAVQDFLSNCRGADMFYPLVGKEDCDRVFPEMQRTWVKLKDGIFTGGNMALIRTSMVSVAADPARAFFAARKSPVQLASLIGLGTLVKLALRTLTIAELEAKMAGILGLSCKAVPTSYPEIGTDVDKESDYNLISAKLKMAR